AGPSLRPHVRGDRLSRRARGVAVRDSSGARAGVPVGEGFGRQRARGSAGRPRSARWELTRVDEGVARSSCAGGRGHAGWGCWLAVLAHPSPATTATHRAAGSPAPPPRALAHPGDDATDLAS